MITFGIMNHIDEVLKKQCELVGADFYGIDFHEEGWFMKHSWTEDKENEFIEWFTRYLYNSTPARRQIMAHPIKRIKACKRTAEFWAFNYGWKHEDTEENREFLVGE